MNEVVGSRQPDIAELCRRFRVRRVEVCAPAARASNGEPPSDLDFLVTVDAPRDGEHAGMRFGPLGGLTKLFDRPVDPGMTPAISNPYSREAIDADRRPRFAA